MLSFLNPYVESEYETESNITDSPGIPSEREEAEEGDKSQETSETNSVAFSSSNTTLGTKQKIFGDSESQSRTSSLFEKYIEKNTVTNPFLMTQF